MKVSYRNIGEFPRFAKFPNFVKDLAFQLNVELVIFEVEKGFFKETVRFEARGEEEKINQLRLTLEKVVYEWNKETE